MFRIGYQKGRASRATLQRRHDQAVAKAEAHYDTMMESGLPFCPNCSNCWVIAFEREVWGGSSGNWLCEAGRKRRANGGKCKHFTQGKRHSIKIRPRDDFVALGFMKAIELELENFDYADFTNNRGSK